MNKRLLAPVLLLALLAAIVTWWLPQPSTHSPQPLPRVEPEPPRAIAAPMLAATVEAAPPAKPADDLAALPRRATGPALPRAAKQRVPTKADAPPEDGRPAASMPLAADFLDKLVDAAGKATSFALPDGRQAAGSVELLRRDAQGVLLVQGKLTQPQVGAFFFQRQTAPGVAGEVVGHVRFDQGVLAFRIDPTGPGGAPMLVEHHISQVVCRALPPPPEAGPAPAAGPEHAPQTHPTGIPIPDYQNGVIPLQSLPGATAVIYLDFDGEKGPFSGWGDFDAAPSGASNTQIKEVWQRVAEDFQGFNINVTTDRRIFDNAPENSRQHVLHTPTTTAAPGAGGVAYIGSFNWTGDTVCWAFYSTGKNAAEVASHEIGHTMGLSHDGRISPNEEYYGGHGSGEVGWAPIMGVGYSENLTQWSKGEYTSADNTEDDLAILTGNNNNVDYRASDHGSVLANASYLEILANNTISNEGIIETRTDEDAFRFTTSGGAVSFTANEVNQGPNVDLLAEIYDAANVLVASANPDTTLNTTVSTTLAAGEYTLRISGSGRGDPLVDGYTDYASMGTFLLTGSVTNGVKPDRFTIAENSANGVAVGTVAPRGAHGANPLTYAIASGNTGNAFAIDLLTGAITVAASAQLNFETLSTRWDDPATYQLFVTVTDTLDPAANESVRVVITVADVNELPTISGGGALTMLEHTRVGTPVRKLTSSDPDRFEFPTFSIVSGNTGGAFAINAVSGQITVAADTNATTQAVYTLSVRATDHGTPALNAMTTVTITLVDIPPDYLPGIIVRKFFEDIAGSAVTDLTASAKFPNFPDGEETLTAFDGGPHGDEFGSVLRGYVIPPATGSYTFWISSSDSAELHISPGASRAAATVRASNPSGTDRYEYTQFPSQQSGPIALQAGQAYYLEARHKENTGSDHVAVAWQGPGISQQVIPGLFLAPYIQDLQLGSPASSMINIPNGVGLILEATNRGKTGVTIAWSKVSGPGTVVFGSPGALTTSATFSTSGAYVLRVTEVDTGITTLIDVTVNVGTPSFVLTGAGIGTQQSAPSHTVAAGVYNITANGNGIPSSDTPDDFYFIHIPASGNVTVTARVVSIADVDGSNSRAGVMIRESLAANARSAFCGVTAVNGARFIYRATAGAASANASANVAQPYWVRLTRSGNSFSAQIAPDSNGTPGAFTALGTGQAIAMSTNALVGLAATSGSNGTTGSIVIDRLTVTPLPVNVGASVNAGADAPVTLPASAALNGTVTDDGKPAPPALTTVWQKVSGEGTVGFGNASAIDTTASFSAGGAYVLRLTANDGQVKTFDDVAITALLAPLEQWRQDRFGVNAGDPLIAGNLADPDRDGLGNLLEYILGLDPLGANGSGLTPDLETIGPNQFLRLAVPRNPAATDVTLTIEVTGDLSTPASWTSTDTTIEANTPTLLRARDNTPVSAAPQRSIRLKITQP